MFSFFQGKNTSTLALLDCMHFFLQILLFTVELLPCEQAIICIKTRSVRNASQATHPGAAQTAAHDMRCMSNGGRGSSGVRNSPWQGSSSSGSECDTRLDQPDKTAAAPWALHVQRLETPPVRPLRFFLFSAHPGPQVQIWSSSL